MPELTLREPVAAAGGAPAPPPDRPVETEAEELARLRANVAASQAAPAPPEGEQVTALSNMVQSLFVAERARNDDVHLQQAKGYERGLQRQSELTALRESQLSRASSIGTAATRTKVIASQLDAGEVNMFHLKRAFEELSKRLVDVPAQPGSPSPASPSAGVKTWFESDEGVLVRRELEAIRDNLSARTHELTVMWASPSWNVATEALEVSRPSSEDVHAQVQAAIVVQEKKQKEQDRKRKAQSASVDGASLRLLALLPLVVDGANQASLQLLCLGLLRTALLRLLAKVPRVARARARTRVRGRTSTSLLRLLASLQQVSMVWELGLKTISWLLLSKLTVAL